MQKIFQEQREAIEYLDKSVSKTLSKRCPVFNSKCREDCASFNVGNITKLPSYSLTESKWQVKEAECDNAIVRGYIFHEGDLNV